MLGGGGGDESIPNHSWGKFRIEELFGVNSNPQLNKDSFVFLENGEYPYFTRSVLNNGITGYVNHLDENHKIKGNSIAVGMLGMQFFYMKKSFYAGQFTKTIYPKFDNFNENIAQYFLVLFNQKSNFLLFFLVRDFKKNFLNAEILLPTKNNKIDFEFMEIFIKAIKKIVIKDVVLYSNQKIKIAKNIINKNSLTKGNF